jgi:anti-anti-sigma factor
VNWDRKEGVIPEELVTSVEKLSHGVVVHVLAGELRKNEVDRICAVVDEARGNAADEPFIINMANVRFVGSMGMGVLVGLAREFQGRGQRLIFAGMTPDVRQSFNLMHLHRILEMVEDLAEARRLVGGGDA